MQVDKFTKPKYRKFNTQQEAQAFVNGFDQLDNNGPGGSNKYFGSPSKSFNSSFQKNSSSNTNTLSTNVKLKIAEKEIEYLKEKLKQKESEKKLLETEAEIEQLKGQGSFKGKSTPMKHSLQKSKPYQQKTPTNSNSSNWKQNRKTKLIDMDEARQLHTDAFLDGMESDDRSPVVYTDGACSNNGQGEARAGIGVYWGPDHPLLEPDQMLSNSVSGLCASCYDHKLCKQIRTGPDAENTSERLSGRQTNNRAEIHAVVRAVQQARISGFDRVTVKTDSMFVINSMTKWLHGWQKKGWKTASGSPVINREDFECLLEEMDGIEINWVYVRGHQGNDGNVQADELAVIGASKPPVH